MKIIHEEQYRKTLSNESWHDKLEEAAVTFKNAAHADITSELGFNSIMSSEALGENYTDMVASLAKSDETTYNNLKSVMRHSMHDARTGVRSGEAADAMANNANYNALAKLNSWVIVGYTARSKALELYHTITSDDPTVSYKYTIDYTVRGSDTKKYYHPQADRDGDLADMYDLPQLLPSDNTEFLKENTHLENDTFVDSTNEGSTVWIKVAGGVTGNLFKDANNAYDMTKFTLEKNPRVTGIKYSIPNTENTSSPYTGAMSVFFERNDATGNTAVKHFFNHVDIPYKDGAASASGELYGQINLDTGDYSFSSVGAITAIQLDVRLTNVANELGTIRSGSETYVESFNVDNHPYATVPISPEVSDDFNIAGEGVSAVAYWTDQVTKTLANARDQVFERELDKAYARPAESFDLFNKLGGWKRQFDFPVTARLPGGGDPFSWMKTGIKQSLVNHLLGSEQFTYFEDDTQRQWYILGHETDTNLIPDITYSNWDGNEGGIGGASEKYGFGINGRAGYVDSMGRAIRIIGSTYKRHYANKAGKRVPMRAVLKSTNLDQPTTIYLPYSFRVYSGIMPEYSNRTGLIVSCRDCIKVMSLVQSRITFSGNSDNLYRDIVANNTVSGVTFPEGSNKIEITASNA